MGLFSRLKRMCIRMAAEEGYAPAQTYIGVWYAKGDGVEQDQPVAAQWYRKAAEQGNAAAQFYLGISYRNGNGVEQDQREALNWFRKAAEQGIARAQQNV